MNYKNKPNTVGRLMEILSQYPKETMICVEDMDGNAFYFDDNIAEHLDCDDPTVEILIPVYITELAIEQGCEGNVFTNPNVKEIM